MMITEAKAKACRVCGGEFQPFQSLQIVCGVACARKVPVIARKQVVAEKRETRAKIESLRPRKFFVKQAQHAFNAWIRERDAALPCISCNDRLCGGQKFGQGQYDAGHYLTTGARPELRFDETNVHKQCKQCNLHLHGNPVLFRIGLIARIGTAAVQWLEGPHPAAHLSVDDLKAIRDKYRGRLRSLQKGSA